MNSQHTPVALGVAGAGGFAAAITDLVLREGAQCAPPVRLVSVAEPDVTTHAARLAALRAQGVATVAAFDELLARPDLEAVWLPVPIPLHRPFTERALAAGKAVLCEKPAAGALQDVDAMIAARDRAGRPVAVGFQHLYEPATRQVKRWLVDGRLGRLRSATLHAGWPRSVNYFQRNTWAGRIQQNGVWVLDSPTHNALAHVVNLTLFFLGPTLTTSATTEWIDAELYRAQPIENYDTLSLRAHLPGEVTALILLTHSCQETVGPVLVIEGDRGRLTWSYDRIVLAADGSTETLASTGMTSRHVLERFARLVRGEPDDTRLVSTLETARAQVQLVNAASAATAITPVPGDQVQRIKLGDEPGVAIRGIEAVFAHCVARRQMLHESGLLPFTRPAGRLDTRSYRHFAGPRG